MRNPLTRRLARERGATTVIVAIFLPIVFIGLLAMTVDYGSMMFERRQLQNVADASAVAFAQVCAESSVNCDPSTAYTSSVLSPVLGGNSADGLSQLNATATMPYGICGRGTGGTNIVTCPSATSDASISDLAQCPPLPTWLTTGTGLSVPYVEAYSKTKVAPGASAGTSVLPSFFSSALPGSPGQNTTVRACARAAWGPTGPSTQMVLGMTISECDWKSITGYDDTTNPPTPAVYPPGPVGIPGYDTDPATPQPSWPTEQYVYTTGNPTSCNTSSPGGTAPGGFAWLSSTGNCQVSLTTGSWIQSQAGNAGCPEANLAPYWKTVIYVPVFDCVSTVNPPLPNPVPTGFTCTPAQGGTQVYYHIAGFAAFYLSGWNLTQGTQQSISPTAATSCPAGGGNSARCIFGWFLHDLIPAGSILPPPPGGTPNYGLNAVVNAG